jgi:hypothetical protein
VDHPTRNGRSLIGQLPHDVVMRRDVLPKILANHEARLEAIETSIHSASQSRSGPSIEFSKVTSGHLHMGGISYVRLMILAVLFGVAIGKADFLIKRIAGSLG